MKKFLIALALLLGVVFIITQIAEVQAIAETLQRGDWRYLLLALAVELVWMVTVAATYQSIYQVIGLHEKVRNLLPVAAAAQFMNIVAPIAGMSGMAVFVAEARRRSYSQGRAAIANALNVLFDYAAFLGVLALGLSVLIRRDRLNAPEIIASAILVTISIILVILIYLGMRSAQALGQALAWMVRVVNRVVWPFTRRPYLSEKRAYEFASEAAAGLKELVGQPLKLVIPIVLALTKQALLIVILLLSFLAFKVPVSPGTLIAGYSIGYLFMIISPTPVGMGVVEGMLTLALSSMYVPVGAAAVVTLAYRGFTFWLPLLLGMVAFRWLGGTKDLAHVA